MQGLQSSPSARRSSSILQDLDSAQQQLRSICSPSPTPSHPRQPPSSTKIPAHPIPTPLPPPKATHGLSPLSKTPSSQTPPRSSLQNTPVRKAGAAKLPAGAPATPGTTASTPARTGRTPVNTPALKSWATPQGKPVFSEQAFAAALQTHQQLAEGATMRRLWSMLITHSIWHAPAEVLRMYPEPWRLASCGSVVKLIASHLSGCLYLLLVYQPVHACSCLWCMSPTLHTSLMSVKLLLSGAHCLCSPILHATSI